MVVHEQDGPSILAERARKNVFGTQREGVGTPFGDAARGAEPVPTVEGEHPQLLVLQVCKPPTCPGLDSGRVVEPRHEALLRGPPTDRHGAHEPACSTLADHPGELAITEPRDGGDVPDLVEQLRRTPQSHGSLASEQDGQSLGVGEPVHLGVPKVGERRTLVGNSSDRGGSCRGIGVHERAVCSPRADGVSTKSSRFQLIHGRAKRPGRFRGCPRTPLQRAWQRPKDASRMRELVLHSRLAAQVEPTRQSWKQRRAPGFPRHVRPAAQWVSSQASSA